MAASLVTASTAVRGPAESTVFSSPVGCSNVRMDIVLKYAHALCLARGYTVLDTLETPFVELLDFFRNIQLRGDSNPIIKLLRANTPTGVCSLLYVTMPSLSIVMLRSITKELVSSEIARAIVFYPESLTHSVRVQCPANIEIHLLQSVFPLEQFRIVPRHRALSSQEKAELYAKYHLEDLLMPKLQASDAVAKYLAFVPGTVVEIKRGDGSIYWRLVE